jgi:anti-sigma factor (TIGR02949 family)
MIRKAMGMIPCEEAMARLWEFLDGELLSEDETAVKWHLDVCSRCFPQYDFQRAASRR